MIAAGFDERCAAASDQFFRIGKRNDFICSAVKDHGAGFDLPDRSPILPSRAEQHELGTAAVDVHCHRATTGTSHNDMGLMPVECRLGNPNRLLEVLVGQWRVDNLVAVLNQKARLQAARFRHPAVEKEDFHALEPSFRSALNSGSPFLERTLLSGWSAN